MCSSPYILVVEDDPEIRRMVVDLLSRESWETVGAENASSMDALVKNRLPDLIVLDVNLPGEDGLSICKRVSASTNIAIIMLTARSDDIDRIIGLEIGADDYLGKPFNPRELTARVRALLRRSKQSALEDVNEEILHVSGLTIERRARGVWRDGTEIKLSGAEFDLLLALAEAPGRVLSRDHLLECVHGRSGTPFDRSIDVLVSRLRKKIDDSQNTSLIDGVRNAGYVLKARM